MPKQARGLLGDRDRRIREACAAGRSTKWIAATFGLHVDHINRILREFDVPRRHGWGSDTEPPATWEQALAFGTDLAETPADEWLDTLEDAASERSSDTSVVYFVQEKGSRYVKIGVSTSGKLTQRLQNLRIGNPHELELRRVVNGDAETERLLHTKFADRRIRGEWFDADDQLASVARLGVTEPAAHLLGQLRPLMAEPTEKQAMSVGS